MKDSGEKADIVITGDSIVSLDGKIFEKPENREHAIAMIGGFSGRV